jgi:hypothetical protein
MKIVDEVRCHGSYRGWDTKCVLAEADLLTQQQRDKVTGLDLCYNKMDVYPAKLCKLFPNLEHLVLNFNFIKLLSREFEQLTSLQALILTENPICQFPSTLTKLTKLETLHVFSRTEFLTSVSYNVKACQSELHRIVSHFEPPRRSATALVGLGKLKRSQILRKFYVPIEFILEMAKLVCSARAKRPQ